jgi:hypothetical protein
MSKNIMMQTRLEYHDADYWQVYILHICHVYALPTLMGTCQCQVRTQKVPGPVCQCTKYTVPVQPVTVTIPDVRVRVTIPSWWALEHGSTLDRLGWSMVDAICQSRCIQTRIQCCLEIKELELKKSWWLLQQWNNNLTASHWHHQWLRCSRLCFSSDVSTIYGPGFAANIRSVRVRVRPPGRVRRAANRAWGSSSF